MLTSKWLTFITVTGIIIYYEEYNINNLDFLKLIIVHIKFLIIFTFIFTAKCVHRILAYCLYNYNSSSNLK